MIECHPLDRGTPVRLRRTVTSQNCCFTAGRHGVVCAIDKEGHSYDIEFDDPYRTLGRIAFADVEPLTIIQVNRFDEHILFWLSEYTPDYRVNPGSVFAQRQIIRITFGKPQDAELFRTVWPEIIVETLQHPSPTLAPQPAPSDSAPSDSAPSDPTLSKSRDADIARAIALAPQAAQGGLRFDVYLPPRLAKWVLRLVAQGEVRNPSEAVFIGMRAYYDLMPHTDLRKELLSRSLSDALDDPPPLIDGAAILDQLQMRFAAPLPPPAVWHRRLPKERNDDGA